MAVQLFGFTIGRVDKDKNKKKSFALPEPEDGAVEAGPTGSAYGTYVDLEGVAKNEEEMIRKYRDMANFPECDQAIDDVINEVVVTNREEAPVSLSLEKSTLSEPIKERIHKEFKEVVRLLDFKKVGYELIRKWYVDGRLYFHIIIDEKNPKRGILELRSIDPLKIKKVRQPKFTEGPSGKEVDTNEFLEYYLFNEFGITAQTGGVTMQIAADAVSYVHSGILDVDRKVVLGHLHKAIKPLNQLRMIEDAVVIYRISRAPERRIFYIDVGNLPKIKAEQYLSDIMNKYKNKLVYDSQTGDVKDDRKHMSMLEDYWLPRKFGFHKRRAHFSSLILTGQMTRDQALDRISHPEMDEHFLQQEFEYVANKLDLTIDELQEIFKANNKTYKEYRNKRWVVSLGTNIMRSLGLEKRYFR